MCQQYKTKKIDQELSRADKYANLIISKHNELRTLLCTTETYATAEDEISRSIEYLRAFIHKQKKYILDEKIKMLCCYLPLNQPLYSFVLNVLTPSFVCERIYYRPPQKLWKLHQKLNDILLDNQSEIQMVMVSRNKFLKDYVSFAEIIVYTGHFENVKKLSRRVSDCALLIYNGSALNPVIVTKNADLSSCCEEIVNARLYNTGQDCMAPAAILLHDDIAEEFIQKLIEQLDYMKVGKNSWNPEFIGSMISEDSFDENIEYVLSNVGSIIYGGYWNEDNFYIGPTIFLNNRYKGEEQKSFYAPFFSIYQYACPQELNAYFSTKEAECHKGYVSVFGIDSDIDSLKLDENKFIVLEDETLFSYENGNEEFGGYGEGCSFVMYGGKKEVHPILLLREISEWRNKR